MRSPTDAPAGTWRQLLSGRYLGTATVLAGGVALYATNEFLTISLLPNAVNDILGYALALAVGTVISAVIMGFFKKPIKIVPDLTN